jgi:hypothetical protein
LSPAFDPDAYLLRAEDVPDGFVRVPDGERTDRMDSTVVKFRTFARDEGILSSGAYVTGSEADAAALLDQTRENYSSVGGMWEPIVLVGDEALRTEVFPSAESIQRIGAFRAGAVTGLIQYTGPRELVQPDDVTRLLGQMVENGRQSTQVADTA